MISSRLFNLKKNKVLPCTIYWLCYNKNVSHVRGVDRMDAKRKTVLFPRALLDKIEKYMEDNHIITFTSATLELIRKGLDK